MSDLRTDIGHYASMGEVRLITRPLQNGRSEVIVQMVGQEHAVRFDVPSLTAPLGELLDKGPRNGERLVKLGWAVLAALAIGEDGELAQRLGFGKLSVLPVQEGELMASPQPEGKQ